MGRPAGHCAQPRQRVDLLLNLELEAGLVVIGFSYTDVSDNLRDTVEPAFELRNGELHRREIPIAEDEGEGEGKESAPKRREWLKHSYAYRFISHRIPLGRRLLRRLLRRGKRLRLRRRRFRGLRRGLL